jgi:formamidopyrimidine-DNA glycosylase
VPVNAIKKRVNTFQDDGIEAKDITTPDIKPTERKRPRFQPIYQTCQKCNKSIQTHPTHKRDFFICDRCIGK